MLMMVMMIIRSSVCLDGCCFQPPMPPPTRSNDSCLPHSQQWIHSFGSHDLEICPFNFIQSVNQLNWRLASSVYRTVPEIKKWEKKLKQKNHEDSPAGWALAVHRARVGFVEKVDFESELERRMSNERWEWWTGDDGNDEQGEKRKCEREWLEWHWWHDAGSSLQRPEEDEDGQVIEKSCDEA